MPMFYVLNVHSPHILDPLQHTTSGKFVCFQERGQEIRKEKKEEKERNNGKKRKKKKKEIKERKERRHKVTITTVRRVLWLRKEDTASRYGGKLQIY